MIVCASITHFGHNFCSLSGRVIMCSTLFHCFFFRPHHNYRKETFSALFLRCSSLTTKTKRQEKDLHVNISFSSSSSAALTCFSRGRRRKFMGNNLAKKKVEGIYLMITIEYYWGIFYREVARGLIFQTFSWMSTLLWVLFLFSLDFNPPLDLRHNKIFNFYFYHWASKLHSIRCTLL